MRREEIQDVIRLALNMASIAIFCIILTFLYSSAKNLYKNEAWITNEGELLRNEAADYLFEYGENISGNDIVEFILKYDNKYDYYIMVNGRTYPITNDVYLSYLQNPETVETANTLWSQDYLVNKVMKDKIYDNFFVTIDESKVRKIYRFVVQ